MATIRAMMGSLMGASQFTAEHGIAGHQSKASEAENEECKIEHGNASGAVSTPDHREGGIKIRYGTDG